MQYHEWFEEAFKTVIGHEGGYVNNPNDKGGETKYGISKRSYPSLDIKNLTLDHAKYLYYNDYWVKNKCNIISTYYTAEKLFDLSVNMGCKQAAIVLQRALRSVLGKELTEDGIVGLNTTNTLLKAPEDRLITALRSEAAGFYRLIVQKDPTQKEFLNGWLNRAYS